MNTMELAFRKALTKKFSKSIKNSYVWSDFVESTKNLSGEIAKSLKSISERIK